MTYNLLNGPKDTPLSCPNCHDTLVYGCRRLIDSIDINVEYLVCSCGFVEVRARSSTIRVNGSRIEKLEAALREIANLESMGHNGKLAEDVKYWQASRFHEARKIAREALQ